MSTRYYTPILATLIASLISPLAFCQRTVAELHASYQGFVARVSLASVESHFYSAGVLGPVSGIETQRDAMIEQIRQSEDLQRIFRQKHKESTGEVLGLGLEGIERAIFDRFDQDVSVATSSKISAKHQFSNGRIPQITHRSTETKSPEGGVFQLLQYGVSYPIIGDSQARWTILEPETPDRSRVVSRKSVIKLKGMCPPGFEHNTVATELDTGFALLWAEPRNVVSYGSIDSATESLQIVGRPIDESQVLLAAYALEGSSSIPIWISFCSQAGGTIGSQLRHLMYCINAISNEQPFKCFENQICPQKVTYFNDLKDVAGIGGYPFLVSQSFVVARMGAEQDFKQNGAMHTLDLSDFRVGDSVEPVVPIAIINGTSYLDRDSGIGIVVGETSDSQILKMLSFRKKANWFFAINGFLIIIAVAVYLVRRRRLAS